MGMDNSSVHDTKHHIMNTISREFSSAVLILLASVLVGCSGNEATDTIDNMAPAIVRGISFSLTEPDFDEREVVASRALGGERNAADTLDLGDGVLAETSMTRESGTLATRAPSVPMSNGNYTVLAYDASGVLQGQINAKVSSNKFRNNDIMILEPGTYTFVCLNDKVDFSGGVISVSQANAEKARIGRTVMSISGARVQIPFTMYHVGLRVRVSLEAMVNIPKNVKAILFDNSGNTPTVTNYDPITGTYTTGATGNFSGTIMDIPSTGSTDFSKVTYTSTPKTNGYQYLLPNSSSSLKLKFTSADPIYHKDLAGVIMTPKQSSTLEVNGTYRLNVKLTKVFKYVFDDGTVDYLRNKGARTPIALVISETDRSAISLKDANNGEQTIWTTRRNTYNNPVAEQPSQHDQIPETSKGQHWTWDANGSKDGVTVKANEPVNCPAFYHAAHYDPGVTVTGSNLSNWYLGANTDWKNVYLYVGFGTNKTVNAASSVARWYYHVVNKAFVDAGGTTIFNTDPNINTRNYWSSTYYHDFNVGLAQSFNNGFTDGNHSLNEKSLAYVRAFIHY